MEYWANEVGGYWFIDIAATEIQEIEDVFVSITMTVKENKAVIICDDGNGNVY